MPTSVSRSQLGTLAQPADSSFGLLLFVNVGVERTCPHATAAAPSVIAAQHTPRNAPRGLPVLVIGVSPYGPAGRRGRQDSCSVGRIPRGALLASRKFACSANPCLRGGALDRDY